MRREWHTRLLVWVLFPTSFAWVVKSCRYGLLSPAFLCAIRHASDGIVRINSTHQPFAASCQISSLTLAKKKLGNFFHPKAQHSVFKLSHAFMITVVWQCERTHALLSPASMYVPSPTWLKMTFMYTLDIVWEKNHIASYHLTPLTNKSADSSKGCAVCEHTWILKATIVVSYVVGRKLLQCIPSLGSCVRVISFFVQGGTGSKFEEIFLDETSSTYFMCAPPLKQSQYVSILFVCFFIVSTHIPFPDVYTQNYSIPPVYE